MTKNKYLSLLILLLVTFIAPVIGSYVTSVFKEPWYSEIIQPSFNPPSWVFPPVWTTLYVMMSIAIWRVWIAFFNSRILKLYFIHLFFNCIWSIIFFGFHQIGLALINIIVILFFIIILMKEYLKIDKLSFYLMIPYFLWSSFALVLNASILFLN
ncbi:tryptophan-rich sensory protein [Pelagibacterales bacterium SAG-MED28]|nr:tryptophan-rich sensory protein [Pelagibacterales bacterium SAG-MED28]